MLCGEAETDLAFQATQQKPGRGDMAQGGHFLTRRHQEGIRLHSKRLEIPEQQLGSPTCCIFEHFYARINTWPSVCRD